jgi:NADPH:quinone reductase-like Zn-dependent oxidoreductase
MGSWETAMRTHPVESAGEPTMMAVVMHQKGGPAVLRYERVQRPQPGPGEALLRVHAATVNHTDIFHRGGRFIIQKELPHILGMDVAGEVVELGPDAEGWQTGTRAVATFEALGRERDGAYAEYTTVPVAQLHRIPQGLGSVAAACTGLAFTTAWIALFDTAGLADGERVVIHAASSGVGISALQIARWKGAQVIAISEGGKAVRLRSLGADTVVDRRSADVVGQVLEATEGRGATLVLELVGHSTLKSSLEMLSGDGRIVCAGTLSGDVAEINVMDLIVKRAGIRGSFGVIRPADFDTILQLFAAGTFRPIVDSILPLRDARQAHERIEARQAFGKIVLVPDSAAEAAADA